MYVIFWSIICFDISTWWCSYKKTWKIKVINTLKPKISINSIDLKFKMFLINNNISMICFKKKCISIHLFNLNSSFCWHFMMYLLYHLISYTNSIAFQFCLLRLSLTRIVKAINKDYPWIHTLEYLKHKIKLFNKYMQNQFNAMLQMLHWTYICCLKSFSCAECLSYNLTIVFHLVFTSKKY